MKLYFNDIKGVKHYLEYEASSRSDLNRLIGNDYFVYDGNVYSTSQVYAESAVNSALPAIFGGAIGILGGGVGVAIGAAVGAMAGESLATAEKRKVEEFNAS
ncbi:TPA: hypothetical protein RQL25_004393 [Vibrio vulnificus]|uniref:hypothetical protein n=1 Tax=Vibrio vulnificus TaxID=672 RepID=UPI0019D4D793|nr:hypothetical protein [Vibrio vulnificus]MBN8156655.1 hypothetical protein [Vibrio vulnificus]MCJ0806995.1 hypothetical protein [Vibrio vulnificus]HAS6281778.1 hypothetical protein [Vibrio vulnificus]HBH7891290.1 hypothetical protein [Vibrio vulnificus]HDY7531118.1 hypothetical protein [Vibrio vulnificus]